MSDPEAGKAVSRPPVRPPSSDGYKGGPQAGFMTRMIRKVGQLTGLQCSDGGLSCLRELLCMRCLFVWAVCMQQ
jgi:hypothetical protein